MTTTDEPAGVPTGVYVPIDCDRHSGLEVAIVKRRRLRLAWDDGNVRYQRRVAPLDLETCAGEEFLIALDDAGVRLRIRLDRLRRVGSE